MRQQPEWTPERTIDPPLGAAVIAEQFPELAGQPVRAFDSGWDNMVLAVGDEWLFRFIHRAIALDGAGRELAVLRHLADRFTVPIPYPQHVGRPTAEVPWPFWGTRALPGTELALAGLPDGERADVATDVGTFLHALHSPDLARETAAALAADGVVLPVDPLGRADPGSLQLRTRKRLDAMLAAGTWASDARVMDLLDRTAGLGRPADAPVLVHGDLHLRHVLVHEGRAGGAIDWGDTALADPAVDLMIGYSAFVGPARAAFLAAYGDVPPDRELRARVLAVHVSAALLDHAATEGMQELATEAAAALGRATA